VDFHSKWEALYEVKRQESLKAGTEYRIFHKQ
jgi:hypothetical protein